MAVAYFDCFAGAGGDMIVAALLDAGCDFASLRAWLAKLPLGEYSLSCQPAQRGGITAVKFNVEVPHHDLDHQPQRRLGDCLSLIDQAGLAPRAADRARQVFTRLAQAEAKVHGCHVDQVHFHEVGAVDSIIDIVAACVALELLEVHRVYCSVIPVGSGTITCAHGVMPVPAPATAELLRGTKTRQGELLAEMTTPTAAAVLTTLAESFGPMPAMDLAAVGYGAGSRDNESLPNLLRVFVGDLSDSATADAVVELSANIDDSTGEVIGAAMDALLSAGCLDVWAGPIIMKKSRPAWQISALCEVGDAEAVERILFAETTTLGVRRRLCHRSKLHRTFQTVNTPYGPVRIKVASRGDQIVTASPEFVDCHKAAQTHHVPVREVLASAQAAHRREQHE